MAIISQNKFDPLLGYVNVRLQQGVPIVDADVNELDDIRKFELRAFLKWFVGDGVPDGNEGFRVVRRDSAPANDFVVSRGVAAAAPGTAGTEVALRNVGRIIVDGLDVMIAKDLVFTEQPLYAERAGSAAEAARLGVPVVPKLATPAGDGTLVVYLDLWERVVTAAEKPELVHPGLGVETCARTRREWVVRTRPGIKAPVKGDPDFLAGHAYSALALIQRRAGDPNIQTGDILDQRARRLMVPPATLVEDLFGVDPLAYRNGAGRPPISVRAAVNALLRGEMPATPDAPVDRSTANETSKRGFVFDTTGGLVLTLGSDRVAGVEQAFAGRLELSNIAGGFTNPLVQVSAGADIHTEPHLALLPGGDLLVVYQHKMGPAANIQMKRGSLTGLPAAPEIAVATDATVEEKQPFLAVTGSTATVFFHRTNTNQWNYRRWNTVTSSFGDAAPIVLSGAVATVPEFHAAADAAGKVWAAFRTKTGSTALSFDPASGSVAQETAQVATGASAHESPFVLPVPGAATTTVWVFWRSTGAPDPGLYGRVFSGGSWKDPQPIAGTSLADHHPCAVADAEGGIWLFFARGDVGSRDLFAMRRDLNTGTWGPTRQLTATGPGKDESAPHAMFAADRSIWLLWNSGRDATNLSIYYKRLVTAI
ncbi:DUF6519 domain-containing protein [Nocardia sp. NPDC050712]|uniref:DUF6519 domain-containing protein n=1 Tax=Nocardia sp. NPDC050712 TaxID=3155518 RepID=UPI0034113943